MDEIIKGFYDYGIYIISSLVILSAILAIIVSSAKECPLNFPETVDTELSRKRKKFRIPAALHNQARSDVFFCCKKISI
jgi:hypothetical protein